MRERPDKSVLIIEGVLRNVKACLCAREGPVRLVHVRERLHNAVLTTDEALLRPF